MPGPSPESEINASPRPIVVIPQSRWVIIACAAAGLAPTFILVGSFAIAQQIRPDRFHLDTTPGPIRWLDLSWRFIPVILVVLAAILYRVPVFGVYDEGIKLNTRRIAPGRSIWDSSAHGFFWWSEVSSCRWSRYQPGVLSVHVGAVDHRVPRLVGPTSLGVEKLPAQIYLVRLPARYRDPVESAIRSCGKWTD